MKKRVFSAEFKAERVLEVLRGEKELNEIASAHDVTAYDSRRSQLLSMLDFTLGSQVYLVCGVTDLRRSINGLAMIVKLQFI